MGAPPHTPHPTPLCHPPQGHIAFQLPSLTLHKPQITTHNSLCSMPSNLWCKDEPIALPPIWWTPDCTLTAKLSAARNHLAITRGQVPAIRINATRCSPILAPACVPRWLQFMQAQDGPYPCSFALAWLGDPNSTTPLWLHKAVEQLLKLVVCGF